MTALSREKRASLFTTTTSTARRTKTPVSHGCASGQAGPLHWKWKRTGMRRLPRAALNIGVTITESATTPKKKAGNDQVLCGAPLRKKAGMCQTAQMTPSTVPAAKGVRRRWSRGRARPRQPNSSMGPMKRARASAGRTPCQGEKENGSPRLPLIGHPDRRHQGCPAGGGATIPQACALGSDDGRRTRLPRGHGATRRGRPRRSRASRRQG